MKKPIQDLHYFLAFIIKQNELEWLDGTTHGLPEGPVSCDMKNGHKLIAAYEDEMLIRVIDAASTDDYISYGLYLLERRPGYSGGKPNLNIIQVEWECDIHDEFQA